MITCPWKLYNPLKYDIIFHWFKGTHGHSIIFDKLKFTLAKKFQWN